MQYLYAILAILSFTTHAIADPFPESEAPLEAPAATKIATPVSPTLTWMSHAKNTAFLLSGICLLPISIKSFNILTFQKKEIYQVVDRLEEKTGLLCIISSCIGLTLEAILRYYKSPSSNQEFRRNIMLALPALSVSLIFLLGFVAKYAEVIINTTLVLSSAAFLGSALWSIKSWVQGRQKS